MTHFPAGFRPTTRSAKILGRKATFLVASLLLCRSRPRTTRTQKTPALPNASKVLDAFDRGALIRAKNGF